MGTTWCRERAVKAQDSKSPFDRVIVKCVNQMSSSESQGVQNNIQNQPSRPTKSTGNHHLESDFGWQDVVLRVPDEAPVPPPRKKRGNTQAHKTPPPPPPARTLTPSIQLEVDTPESKHKIITPLVQGNSFSREKSNASLEVKDSSFARQRSSSSLEVKDSSSSRKKSTSSLEVATTLSRQKSRSFNCLPLELELEAREEPEAIRTPRSVSSMSNRSIATLSEGTTERLDNYLKSCRSFGSLKPEDLITELNQALQQSDGSSESDEWAGIDDWDLGGTEDHITSGTPPLTPTSQLESRKGRPRPRAEFTVGAIPAPRKKLMYKKPSEAATKNNAAPAKFQSSPKSSGQVAKTLIKPEQIPVKDFLRQSEKSTLHEKRRGANLSVDISPRTLSPSNSFTFDFSSGGLAPPRSPQITLPGTPCTPRSLSRCSSPLPPQCREACVTPPSSPTEDTTTSLLRLLNEYHAAAELIGEEDARKILHSLDTPDEPNDESEPNGTVNDRNNAIADAEVEALVDENHGPGSPESGRSSTNQSLADLETALSEFLEASQGKQKDGDDEEDKVTDKSAFAPIKQEPPTVTPRAKKSVKDANPEITITNPIEDKQLMNAVHEDPLSKMPESSFVPIRPDGMKEVEKPSESAKAKTETLNGASVFEPIKEVHDAKPVITITVAAEDGRKKEGVIETSSTPLQPKPAFQVAVDE